MTTRSEPDRVAKMIGADIELGNFIHGGSYAGPTGHTAARAVLACMGGTTDCPAPSDKAHGEASVDGAEPYLPHAQDWGRRWLRNGGCVYIDLGHLELCTPPVRSARDHVAYVKAMYQLARQGAVAADATLEDGGEIHLLANNTDGTHAWGGHFNVLIARAAWEQLFHRRPHILLAYLASFQVSSIIYTGAGGVITQGGTPHFTLTQRGRFMRRVSSEATTFSRGIVNTRDERLAGRDFGRVHCIFFDSSMLDTAIFLRAGVMQVLVSMIEADDVDPLPILLDPVAALHRWNVDSTFTARARLVGGRWVSSLELQWMFFERAARFCERAGCSVRVPHWRDILTRWEETLRLLGAGDWEALSRRVDWVLKRRIIDQALPGWHDDVAHLGKAQMLDQMYACLDPRRGLAATSERAGRADRLVSVRDVAMAMHAAPADVRAAWRSALLAGAPQLGMRGLVIERIDWHAMDFRLESGSDGMPRRYRLHLPDPTAAGPSRIDAALPADVAPVTWLAEVARRAGGAVTTIEDAAEEPCACATAPVLPAQPN